MEKKTGLLLLFLLALGLDRKEYVVARQRGQRRLGGCHGP